MGRFEGERSFRDFDHMLCALRIEGIVLNVLFTGWILF